MGKTPVEERNAILSQKALTTPLPEGKTTMTTFSALKDAHTQTGFLRCGFKF